jgi:hypothetical protein
MKPMKTALLTALLPVFLLSVERVSACYDRETQRWINRDPISETGGVNLFRFVKNLPAGKVDPFGLKQIGATIEGDACYGIGYGVSLSLVLWDTESLGGMGFYFQHGPDAGYTLGGGAGGVYAPHSLGGRSGGVDLNAGWPSMTVSITDPDAQLSSLSLTFGPGVGGVFQHVDTESWTLGDLWDAVSNWLNSLIPAAIPRPCGALK